MGTVCLEVGSNGPLVLLQENKQPDRQATLLICVGSSGSAQRWEEKAEN